MVSGMQGRCVAINNVQAQGMHIEPDMTMTIRTWMCVWARMSVGLRPPWPVPVVVGLVHGTQQACGGR